MAKQAEQGSEVKKAPKANEPAGAAPATVVGPAPGPRRAPGMKEVIQMEWKLVGTSSGTPVTLLKCVDRKDAEAQMVRLEAEGYYENLGIFAASEKVPLSATLIKARKRVIDSAQNQFGLRTVVGDAGSSSGKKVAKASKKGDGAKVSKTFIKAPKVPEKPKLKAAAKKSTKASSAKKAVKKAPAKGVKKAGAKRVKKVASKAMSRGTGKKGKVAGKSVKATTMAKAPSKAKKAKSTKSSTRAKSAKTPSSKKKRPRKAK